MSDASDPRAFYAERLPAQFNRALRLAQASGAAARPTPDELRAVDATIRVELDGEPGGALFLNIERGRMRLGERPARPPFLTLRHDRTALERIAAEADDAATGWLGGLVERAGAMPLTRRRVEALSRIGGCIELEVTGDAGFALRAHFGSGPMPERPDARIRLSDATYRDLRSGRLALHTAFLNLQIAVEGDMQLALRAGLAALAPS